MEVKRHTDAHGQEWEIEQQDVFGEPWTVDVVAEVFGRALVKVRRAGEAGGVWMRAPVRWDTPAALAQLVSEAEEAQQRASNR